MITLIGCVLLVVYLSYFIWRRDDRIRELEADRERLLDRIRYLQDGPPRVLPGPTTLAEQPLPPAPSFFVLRRPEL